MKTPGTYNYEDNRRRKKSHNKSAFNQYSSTERRFDNGMYHKQHQSPGPGEYYGNDLNSGSVLSLDNVKLNDYKLCRLKR